MGKAEDIEKEHKKYLENHISDLKKAVTKNREVIVQDVLEGALSEDKYLNVIKARRMASDDNLHYFKEIERLQGELNGDSGTKTNKKDKNEGDKSPVMSRVRG